MTRPVHVVASFTPEGKTLPLYFRLSLDQDAPVYKVKVIGFQENRLGGYMATYYCTAEVDGRPQELKLIFDAHNHNWLLTLSDTRADNLRG